MAGIRRRSGRYPWGYEDRDKLDIVKGTENLVEDWVPKDDEESSALDALRESLNDLQTVYSRRLEN